MTSDRPGESRPGWPRGNYPPGGFLVPRHHLWRGREESMLARKLHQDQGNLPSLGASVTPHVSEIAREPLTS